LVANARDAMPDGGQLVIETFTTVLEHPQQLPPLPPGRYASLRVKDSGQGMSEETQERVFEPFFTTKSPALGTGLGLATVYGIVKQHGGHIMVESAPGAGSSFSVYLPASDEPVSTPLPAAAPREHRRAKLLLVDDDQAVRDVIASILRRAGHDVTVAPGAQQAIAATQSASFDLLVTDVVMPGMSGIELARELRQAAPSLKVLLLSGYPGKYAQAAGDDPSALYLAKPVTPTVLLAHVDQLLSGST
jgi:two-component system, cell cycle sensor histidine kinase and response regulator CckA